VSRRFHQAFGRLLNGEPPALDEDLMALFTAWAVRHRIAPYAWSIARQIAPALHAALDNEVALMAGLVLVREPILRELFTNFAGRGVTPILFKGLGLAYRYYAAPELRPLGDVDLLVAPGELDRAIRAAQECGFAATSPDPVIQDYYRNAGYNVPLRHPVLTLLELHHALYRDCEPSFVAAIVSQSEPMVLFGQPARILRAPHLFVVLSAHLCVSNPGLRWLWLLDLALIGRGLTTGDWQEILDVARAHGLQLYVLAVLRMLAGLWNVAVGVEVRDQLFGSLRWPERRALAGLLDHIGDDGVIGDGLVIARRSSARPVRGGLGVLESLFPHAGAVCLDLAIPSDAPFFPLHRARHIGLRLRRAMRAFASIAALRGHRFG
jgi:hypothetical protein